jgi:hypothetical protein
MNIAPKTEKLLLFLTELKGSARSLNEGARTALQEDIRFIETAFAVMNARTADDVNELWSRVQFLSRFFGGDYLPRERYNEWVSLCEAFKAEVLDAVATIRNKQIPRGNADGAS